MKTLLDLRRYYDTAMMSDLSRLEEQRKIIIRKLSVVGLICLIIIGAALVLAYTVENAFLIAVIIGVAIWAIAYYWLTFTYKREFKTNVIEKLVAFIDETLLYEREKYINQFDFMASQIFRQHPDRYRGDDRVSGKIGETAIQFSEIHAEYKTETSSRGHQRTQWHTIFKGMFCMADFNKHFTGRVVVLPDRAERFLGPLGTLFQSWNVLRGELIKLDDPEFEKLFVVYGDDQIQARYILSTSLMKRIVDFKKKSKRDIYLAFVEPRIYVAISYEKNVFEPKIFKTLLDFNAIQEYYRDLDLISGIVEDFNLNTRIWSKG